MIEHKYLAMSASAFDTIWGIHFQKVKKRTIFYPNPLGWPAKTYGQADNHGGRSKQKTQDRRNDERRA